MSNDKDYFMKIGREVADRVKELAKRDRRTIKSETELLLELGLEVYERQQRERSA